MMDYYEIGQRIRKIRKAHGMSQEVLAEKADISTVHMSHIETGNNCSVQQLKIIENVVKATKLALDQYM